MRPERRGITVTYSVRDAGVLLLFAFLIVPPLAAILSAERVWRRVAFSWVFGAAGCLAGLEASLRLDWSVGPSIVAAFILLLQGTGMAAKLRR